MADPSVDLIAEVLAQHRTVNEPGEGGWWARCCCGWSAGPYDVRYYPWAEIHALGPWHQAGQVAEALAHGAPATAEEVA